MFTASPFQISELDSGLTLVFSPQRDMLDVSQIMKDLASMVHEQGDAIGKILCACLVFVCVLNSFYIVVPISKDNLCGHVLI